MKEDVKENKIFAFLKRFLSWISAIFVGLLLLLNIIITARAWGNNGEDGLIIKLQSPITIALSIAFILLCPKLVKKIKSYKLSSLLFVYLFYTTLLAIFFYAFWNPSLNADSGDLYGYIINRDKSPLYIQTWPVNLGYLGVMLLSHLVFCDDIFGLFIFNLLAFYLVVVSLFNITKLLFKKESVLRNLIILLVCFLPIYFEIIFFYNDLLGMAFAFFGIWQTLLLRKNNQFRHFLLLAFAILLMLVIRQNTLIILIAIIIYLIFTTKKNNFIYTLGTIIISALVFTLSPLALQATFSKIYGWDFSDKSIQDPTISWVAMGMLDQYDEKLEIEPRQTNIAGWWNGYNRSCVVELKEDCDDYAKETIGNQLSIYTSDPWRGISFYFRKIASQWAEPSFQTPFFMSYCETDTSTSSRRFLCRAATHTVSFLNNVVHLAILALATLAAWNFHKKKTTTWRHILPLLAIFGYFLFSIIWEAKSRYILLVFPLILPFAAYGFELVPEISKKLMAKLKRKS